MYLIAQHTKRIMEECKQRARDAGLQFEDETLEYIVTNRDMLNLSPKVMIPTLYDYWVHDVEVLKEVGKYKLYPSNPYETVINSRPAISFYNDNNPDWLNIMIFYHVLGHIDFFQNNIFFQHTWNDDFVGVALADSRLIDSYRSKYGRWVDYVIEFSRSIDNIIGYYGLLGRQTLPADMEPDRRTDYYFNIFLPDIARVSSGEIFKQKEKYNDCISQSSDVGHSMFFSEIKSKYPEFESRFLQYHEPGNDADDILNFIAMQSPFLKKDENSWMKQVMTIIRNVAMYFAPQIRSKIMNEGWASYWHDKLFISDNRISGHEADYARINAGVTSISRIGLNPYAIGLRLFQYIKESADAGKMSFEYQKISNVEKRENFDKKSDSGKDVIFEIRKTFSDFSFINTFIDREFVAKHNLFVTGKRYNEQNGMIEYYIKSRKHEDYKQMLIDSMYHPPLIRVEMSKTSEVNLYLNHIFEGKQLFKDFIPDVLVGMEFLWGNQVQLETSELLKTKSDGDSFSLYERRVVYTCKNRQISKIEK